MAHVGKKITKAREGIDRNKLYKLDEALKMEVSIFGRPTPVELEYGQVEKV